MTSDQFIQDLLRKRVDHQRLFVVLGDILGSLPQERRAACLHEIATRSTQVDPLDCVPDLDRAVTGLLQDIAIAMEHLLRVMETMLAEARPACGSACPKRSA